jgi:ribonuclease J
MVRIIALGGLGEIGLNMMVVECQDHMLVIDAGLMFPEEYMLGIDYVIPDMEYLRNNRRKIAAVLLTHGHEDHIGALPYLLRDIAAPVYGTAFTLGLVRHKLAEHDLEAAARLVQIAPGQSLEIGPMRVAFIRVGHSVVDGVGMAIYTPRGTIVHTGDFKISHSAIDGMMTDVNRFARCGQEGVLALLSDSTNVEKEGYTISDRQVGESLSRITANSPGRVIVALFASSVSRIQQVVDIAVAQGRKVIFNGRSLEVSLAIAKQLGFLRIPHGIEIQMDQIQDFADHQIVLITTGSQGEPMSVLARVAAGTHKQIRVKPEDTVILSSKFIPGNEKAITHIINNLYRLGADVIYEKISSIHVSGHAFQEELKLMIHLTKPKYFIPIHGEYRHLILHKRLALGLGIPEQRILLAENGQIIEFGDQGGRIGEKVATGRILIDGKGIGDVGRSVLKERRLLSEDGLVVVNMAFDEETGIVIYGPEIVSKGFVFATETGHLLEDAKCVILEVVEDVDPETPNRVDRIRSRVQTALKQYFYFAIGRRPVILPFILEI